MRQIACLLSLRAQFRHRPLVARCSRGALTPSVRTGRRCSLKRAERRQWRES
jgi:hypothetical protein